LLQNFLVDVLGELFSPFQAICADPLHQIEGAFGEHTWDWILGLLNVDPESMALLDDK